MKSPCLKSWHPMKTRKTLGSRNEARAQAACFWAGPGGHPGCMVQPRSGVGALRRSSGAWRPGSCGAHLPMLAWIWGTGEGTWAHLALLWVRPLRWGLTAPLHRLPLSLQDRPLGFIWAQAAPGPVEAGGAHVCGLNHLRGVGGRAPGALLMLGRSAAGCPAGVGWATLCSPTLWPPPSPSLVSPMNPRAQRTLGTQQAVIRVRMFPFLLLKSYHIGGRGRKRGSSRAQGDPKKGWPSKSLFH